MAELTKEKFRPVDRSRFDSDAIVRPTVTYWQDAWRRLRKNPIAVFSMILLLRIRWNHGIFWRMAR